MRTIGICLFAVVIGCAGAAAQELISFQGKTITMIVGFAAGGGTDAYGRLVAAFLGKYLPGSPTVVVRNVPGADGITAMNYLVQQVAPDGYTITMASSTSADPLNYRKAQSHFDATKFPVVGGVIRGGEVLLINNEAKSHLYNKTEKPAVMGSLSGIPRSGMQMTAWGTAFLGWNAKWVIGYRGTSPLMLALERGEIDMTSTANIFLVQKLIESGRFTRLAQTGSLKNGILVPRPDFGDAPIFAKLMDGKITDPVARKAFEYWGTIAVMDKWLALPPHSPKAMLDTYRDAYAKAVQDPEFLERGKKISDDVTPILHEEVETLVNRLGSVSPEALDYMRNMLRKQGLPTE
jgi:tripartite-type tricarboxylate transporter receptor subunit TctC